MNAAQAAEAAHFIRSQLPSGGLFAGMDWRIAPEPFFLEQGQLDRIEKLGRVLLQFNRAVNLLYRKSVEGQIEPWFAGYLDQGKPPELVQLQRERAFKNEVPRVLRPDILLTDEGLKITELDSVPGGIGLTAWLGKTYAAVGKQLGMGWEIAGGAEGMTQGFASIFGQAERVHILVSRESETYLPEMQWLAGELGPRFMVRDAGFKDFQRGDAVYRFFELFDLPNIKSAPALFTMASAGELFVTAPPKPIFEEKLLLSLLWNRNLRPHWRRELGEAFLKQMLELAPYSWVVDPAPLPPQGAIPELNVTDWQQLKTLSQKERNLILKVSGFAETAWGARGVYLGSDLSTEDWSVAVDTALRSFPTNPFILQRYHRPSVVPGSYFDFEAGQVEPMQSRVRLCPYYFVAGEGDAARAQLAGMLATVCPAEKKIIHGMRDAALVPVARRRNSQTR